MPLPTTGLCLSVLLVRSGLRESSSQHERQGNCRDKERQSGDKKLMSSWRKKSSPRWTQPEKDLVPEAGGCLALPQNKGSVVKQRIRRPTFPALQTGASLPQAASKPGFSPGSDSALQGDIWQYLETFLIGITKRCYWHLDSRGQGCGRTCYSAKGGPTTKIIWPKVSTVPWLRHLPCAKSTGNVASVFVEKNGRQEKPNLLQLILPCEEQGDHSLITLSPERHLKSCQEGKKSLRK